MSGAGGGPGGLYSLFVVDDEREIRRGIIESIDWHDWGFTVAGEAEEGGEALEKIALRRPDVVLSDIRMPGVDGIALMKHIHQNYPGMKVIILSGYSDFEYLDMSIKNEVAAYLLKPTDLEAFRETFLRVREQLDRLREEAAERERLEALLRESPAYIRERLRGRDLYARGAEKLAARIIEYIDREFTSPLLSLQSIAGYTGKNPAYISKVFRELTGEHYVRYVQRKRLARARELLGEGRTVHGASSAAGFTDPSSFVKLFKKEYGLTPSEYGRIKGED
jgi:YesN/AraC family two-component response regulator